VVDGEVGWLAAPTKTLMFSGPRGFDISGKVFPAKGLGGLSTFGDLLLGGRFFAGEVEGISWGTLHGSLRINRQMVKESI
jgi:hypothetical protein